MPIVVSLSLRHAGAGVAAVLIRGITISVNYAPLLAVTLPRNMRHLSECVVVTSPVLTRLVGVRGE